jgi:hypothetical protein
MFLRCPIFCPMFFESTFLLIQIKK